MWISSDAETEGNSIDIGDVNADGHIDVLISDNDQQGGLGVVSLYCGPSFDRCWRSGEPSRMESAVSLHDVDLDGDLDVLTGAWWGEARLYKQQDGQIASFADWSSGHVDRVMEVFAWIDVDASHRIVEQRVVEGLTLVPVGAVVYGDVQRMSDRYIYAGQSTEIELEYSTAPELLITDWEPTLGNILLPRQ